MLCQRDLDCDGAKVLAIALAPHRRRTSPRAQELTNKQLPPGRYLAKLYLDKKATLQVKQPLVLNETEFIGQIEFETRWPSGFANKTVIHLPAAAAER